MTIYYKSSTSSASINGVVSVDMTPEIYASIDQAEFLPESSTEVQAFLSAKAEAAKPKEVTMRQARLALLGAGLLPSVEAAIAGMTGAAGDAARIEWEYSNSLKRSQPLVTQLAAGLGLTVGQLDALFLTASTL